MDGSWKSALQRAKEHSPFLARSLERLPHFEALLAAGDGETALLEAKQAGRGIEDAGLALRRERLALALVLAIGDLAGAFPLEKIMRELSAFADRALHRAIEAAILRRVPDAEPTGFIGLALGKHGSGELNYSSDIDPILLYDSEALPRRERDEPPEAAQRYARDIVRLLSDVTAEGYVFRVDLRLRPASEVSPLAISLEAATSHYESSALTWERAAFIRARAASGDIGRGEAFLDAIRSFVWRRSLDFGAIDEIRGLSARIRTRYSGPREPRPGFDLKQGRGGIREIEFFAQTHQLIHGGRDPALRVRGTRAALDALAAAGHIGGDTARTLGEAYDTLRTIEHRLQMVNDRQTHVLPDGDALDGVARLHGLEDAPELLALLDETCGPVARHFGELIAEDTPDGPVLQAIPDQRDSFGFADPDVAAQRIAGWSDGRFRALRSEAAKSAFDAIRPQLFEALGQGPDPDHALARFETLLEKLPSAINLFRLLEARPGLLQQLVDCLTLAAPLADELARRPELLDTLIDRTAFDLPGSVEDLARMMRRTERGDEYEQALDRIRIVTSEQRFTLGVQLIEAAQDPLDVAEALSRVAEAAVQVACEAAQDEFAERHGRFADGELLVLGLGRLGGGALTHASDLDMIYLFTDGETTESDGARPLGRTLYFNRLAQRVGVALSVPTAQGALYEVDTRLRPQGNQGPLAVGLASFERYQRENAWTWEHMALNRARVLVGSLDARQQVEAIVDAILHRHRDAIELQADVLKMRSDMAAHKPARGPLDVKLLRGGLVDLEFLIHFLQLRDRIALRPDLSAAIADLAEQGLVAADLRAHHRLLTRVLVGSRLLAPDLGAPGPAARAVLSRLARQEDYASLLQALDRARHGVAAQWAETFGEKLEMDR
ncbi:glutamine-synthetase adenylyltransferase [Erythrobacter sp. QSSC1-22B]|uniref:bifunctional [glutamate--ammonia ligase]-adenylyl-L-tyrosine phosphorylase/[glutamate--ammonia-ligase] adenylyltransferase n=1 Tax=Erythrobacter sp. QSSC1-22B TaxID=1860125 RepID=UPI000804E8E2|nr:bifunctional [glutamate--ammonia ligase]-adenylyl-L-tyrosine phosphorylase/[glutamate--ammonia-ligase] adenylyltransferase [Erythrobacter sp. QSSC1-22B]OBX18102.1 glutamine-synthetase adenylyltransferase [Erythrobacter sp. QSSC1-22B]